MGTLSILYAWILIGVIFLIVEMLTTTLYGLSISIAAFVLAIYIWLSGATEATTMQYVIFAVISSGLCLVLPRVFNGFLQKDSGVKFWLDASIGKSAILSRAGDDWKIAIDGVNYLVHESCITENFASRKKVIIDGHEGGLVIVHLVSDKA